MCISTIIGQLLFKQRGVTVYEMDAIHFLPIQTLSNAVLRCFSAIIRNNLPLGTDKTQPHLNLQLLKNTK